MTKQNKQEHLKNAQKALNLELIYLHKLESSLDADKTPFDLTDKSIDIGLEFSVGGMIEGKKQKKNILIYPCKNIATFTDTETKKAVFKVSSEYRAIYSIENKEISAEEKKVFGEVNVMYHVYPYLREFLQSHLLRMGMPSFTMPMLLAKSEKKPAKASPPKKRKG